ncbi:hypothetical protein H9Q74_008692 [Fusarium xylarioides]|nr:hypothetical protein H9Q71_008579 [Fusarium xylarioides]KAG5820777.1 hypothetical protein H9Q74_008692 [Fusarium xylarioides]
MFPRSRNVWLRQGEAPPENDVSTDDSGHGSDEAGPSDDPPSAYPEMLLESDLPIFSRLLKAKSLSLIMFYIGLPIIVNESKRIITNVAGYRLLLAEQEYITRYMSLQQYAEN